MSPSAEARAEHIGAAICAVFLALDGAALTTDQTIDRTLALWSAARAADDLPCTGEILRLLGEVSRQGLVERTARGWQATDRLLRLRPVLGLPSSACRPASALVVRPSDALAVRPQPAPRQSHTAVVSVEVSVSITIGIHDGARLAAAEARAFHFEVEALRARAEARALRDILDSFRSLTSALERFASCVFAARASRLGLFGTLATVHAASRPLVAAYLTWRDHWAVKS